MYFRQNFKEEKIPLFYNIIATMRDIQDRELNEAWAPKESESLG